ncbi:hypothetical protein GOP47_0018255 [Adiantum capillus-veneris]|uniref:Exocyst subunit Exo70 family protein n=1 Tax=Adiantum capillus-veneris TaxID=13818 RepID=A0A9D4UHF1_ADICA|nr:hypothetical protein GOP47_0018255 [Adiantum capillus-veneris]
MEPPENFRESLDQAGKTVTTCTDGPASASYLEAVDTLRHLLDAMSLGQTVPANDEDHDTLDEAQSLLQLAMSRMEDEFRHSLELHSESVDPEWLFDPVANPSFGSISDDLSVQIAAGDESGEGEEEVATSRPLSNLKLLLDMLPPEIVPSLADIAARMINCGYKMECCQQYIQVRKTILEESLFRLGVERFTIEDVQKMTPDTLETEILQWMKAFSVSVGVLFPSEKQLCEQVFVELPSISEWCFAEVGKGAMTQLLNFAEAVAIGRRSPEKLPRILDMYEELRDLMDDIGSIFSGASCANLRAEASGVLSRLGEAARGTFAEFASAIKRDTARMPVPGGAVHPLTRYVMNYLRLLSCFSNTLNEILGNQRSADSSSRRSDEGSNPGSLYDDNSGQLRDDLPLSVQIVYLIELLENNLDGKAKLYRDNGLQFLFLMNNFQYIVQKVKASEVRRQLSDDWLRRHMGKVRQFHNAYLRGAWHKVLACLRDEGIHSGGSSFSGGVSKSVLKERFKQFNTTFDEVVKTQQSWIVSDPQLCADLRISIVEMVLPAYRAFLGRFRNHLESEKNSDRFLKYNADDMEVILNDLFNNDGSSSVHRRGSFSTN